MNDFGDMKAIIRGIWLAAIFVAYSVRILPKLVETFGG